MENVNSILAAPEEVDLKGKAKQKLEQELKIRITKNLQSQLLIIC